jgi:flagellar biosynthesis protein FliQ
VSVTDIAAAARDMLMLTLLLVTPFLLAAMLTSFAIGVLQAATRINDMTLSFVPRLLATLLALYLAADWAATHIVFYFRHAFLAAAAIGR